MKQSFQILTSLDWSHAPVHASSLFQCAVPHCVGKGRVITLNSDGAEINKALWHAVLPGERKIELAIDISDLPVPYIHRDIII